MPPITRDKKIAEYQLKQDLWMIFGKSSAIKQKIEANFSDLLEVFVSDSCEEQHPKAFAKLTN
ncbi:hypothetical protein KJ365_05205 [Glaciecola sp. XM2]|uniref:hypothetical protein n=1 Tax=Glaciecola sp. XM2 TaxID=1914931 RepID=UPI001BDEFF99|nr:hypothetical protein [Glaciecola sp. XM2]MBT1450270.1 hypothetical protein [Glaciecola sp. XM2]